MYSNDNCYSVSVHSLSAAGVLYVHIHSATGLMASDADGLSDPYCVLLVNKKKVLTNTYMTLCSYGRQN